MNKMQFRINYLLEALYTAQNRTQILINQTPTEIYKNMLIDINSYLLSAIDVLKNLKIKE